MKVHPERSDAARIPSDFLPKRHIISSRESCRLSFPHTLQRRLANKDAHEIGRILEEAVHSLLQDLSEWPMRVVDPNWMEHIDEDLRPDSGSGNSDAREQRERANAQRERANSLRRERRAKAKEG